MPRRRLLRPDEEALWRAVAASARALHPANRPFLQTVAPPLHPVPLRPEPDASALAAPPRLPHFRLGEKSRPSGGHDFAPSLAESLAAGAVQMDAKTHARMTRGKLVPDARLDLHGLTLCEAHPELIRFVLNAQAQGLRLVLIITGKGRRGQDIGPIPQRLGALRHQVPHWLRLPPLGHAVLQVAEAHLRHGGSGAYYVYLRRGRP